MRLNGGAGFYKPPDPLSAGPAGREAGCGQDRPPHISPRKPGDFGRTYTSVNLLLARFNHLRDAFTFFDDQNAVERHAAQPIQARTNKIILEPGI